MSQKAKDYEREFRIAKERVTTRSGGRCEIMEAATVGTGAAIGAWRNGRCLTNAVETHHIRRRSQGGTNDDSNLLDLCFDHHAWIHAHPTLAAERGWLVMSKVGG